jgi:HEPN domain-containing protein
METNLNTLTTGQLEELQPVISLLVNQFQPEKIICFGSLSTNNKAYGCFMEAAAETNKSHYFLLIVTKDVTRVEFAAQDYINTHYEGSTITIVAHGSKTITECINRGNRFFNTVYRDGTLLYAADGILTPFQSLPDIDHVSTVVKAKTSFDHRYGMSSGFLEASTACWDKGFLNNSVFLLHQALEQACIAFIRVFTGYRPDLHNLDRLLKLCLCCDPSLSVHFPRNTDEEIRLFRLLNHSYSNTRYKEDFHISEDDADNISNMVSEFMLSVDDMCQRKIEDLETLANLPHEHVKDYTPLLTAAVLIER